MGMKRIFATIAFGFLALQGAKAALLSDVITCGVITVFTPENGTSEFNPAICNLAGNGFADQQILLYDDPGLTILSDQIYIQANFLYFASDTNFQTLTSPVVAQLQETGAIQDLSNLFIPGTSLPAGSITVVSDLDTAPEPGTLLMIAPAVLIFGVRRLRRHTA
jgi:hypothetical protein